MATKNVTFFEAVAVLVSSIIGAGILGIPFAAAKAGWLLALAYLIGLGALLMGLNLLLGEIVARTKQPLQIPGLAAKYLGQKGKGVVSFITLFSGYGALLAYIIGEGEVLRAFFGGTTEIWSLIFWLVAALAVFFGLRLIKKLDLILTLFIFACLTILVFWSAPQFHLPNLFKDIDWRYWLLPYGVILFALQGVGAIPQVEELLPAQQKRLKSAIVVGSLIPVAVYFIFMTAIVGITGASTTDLATVGLSRNLGSAVATLGGVFAFFTMGTCFLNIALAVKKQFEWDYKMNRTWAWLATVAVPLIAFELGARNFIKTIDFLGAVFGGLSAITIVLIYWRAKRTGDLPARGYHLVHTTSLSFLLVLVFAAGAVLTILGLI